MMTSETVFQTNARRFATTDTVRHADMVLDVAVKAAVQSIRRGRPGHARHQLQIAGERASRVLGPTDWSATSQRGAS